MCVPNKCFCNFNKSLISDTPSPFKSPLTTNTYVVAGLVNVLNTNVSPVQTVPFVFSIPSAPTIFLVAFGLIFSIDDKTVETAVLVLIPYKLVDLALTPNFEIISGTVVVSVTTLILIVSVSYTHLTLPTKA